MQEPRSPGAPFLAPVTGKQGRRGLVSCGGCGRSREFCDQGGFDFTLMQEARTEEFHVQGIPEAKKGDLSFSKTKSLYNAREKNRAGEKNFPLIQWHHLRFVSWDWKRAFVKVTGTPLLLSSGSALL